MHGSKIAAIVLGVITIVIGLALGSVVVQSAAADDAAIGSFAGAKAIKNLVPLVYYAVVIGVGVGMMAIGVSGYFGRGPMGQM